MTEDDKGYVKALEDKVVECESQIDNLNDELKTLRHNYVWVCDRLNELRHVWAKRD